MVTTLQDSLNLAKTLTPRKIWNASKVVFSFYASRLTKKPRHIGAPVTIGFEPTTFCNLRCPECPSGLRSFTRPTGMLTLENFRRFTDELAGDLISMLLYFQGEPYLNPDFLEIVRYAVRQGVYTATSTNAHYLTPEKARETVESGLHRLIISIDGTTQETYEVYRVGGSLSKVIEGTRNVLTWRRALKSPTPVVFFQFLVVKPNEHQVEDVKRLGKKLGVDKVLLKTAQIYKYDEGSDLIPDDQRYSRYRKQRNGKYEIKNRLLNHCWKLWQGAEVTWDGRVLPCCFDKDAQYAMGSLLDQPFETIWRNGAYERFRTQILRGRKNIDICRNCTEGTKIWA